MLHSDLELMHHNVGALYFPFWFGAHQILEMFFLWKCFTSLVFVTFFPVGLARNSGETVDASSVPEDLFLDPDVIT